MSKQPTSINHRPRCMRNLAFLLSILLNQTVVPALAKEAVDINAADNPWKVSVPITTVSRTGVPTGKLVAALNRGNYAEARKILAATNVRPDNKVEITMWQAASLAAEKRYEEAVELFDRLPAAVLNAAPVIVRADAAKSYAMANQFDKAIALSSGILAKYQMVEAYKIRAGGYAAQNKLVLAANDFETLSDLELHGGVVLYSRAASLYLKAGKVDRALAVLDKGDKRKHGVPDNALQMVRTDCYISQGRWQDAINIYNEMIKRNSSSVAKNEEVANFVISTCYKERAKCYRKLGKNALADADLKTLEKRSETLMDDFIGRH